MSLDRRHFFKGLLALPVVGKLLAKRVANPPPAVPVPTPKPQLIGFDNTSMMGSSIINISCWGNYATVSTCGGNPFLFYGPEALKPPAPEDYKNPYWKDS